MSNLEDQEKGKRLELDLGVFRSNLVSTVTLINGGFLLPGTPLGLGEICEAPSMDMPFAQVDEIDPWVVADEEERRVFLRNVIIELGLVPEQLTSERAAITFEDEGLRGEPSEGGAIVLVFDTKYPQLRLHVKRYKKEFIGNHYDLVVEE